MNKSSKPKRLPPILKKTGKIDVPPKSKREVMRDFMMKTAHDHDEKIKNMGKPTLAEIAAKEKQEAQDKQMKADVRRVLDTMMQELVAEVSIKLGGAIF